MSKIIKVVFFLAVTSIFMTSMACKNSSSRFFKEILIEFDGGKDAFYDKYDLWTSIKDSSLIYRIQSSIDTNQRVFLCPKIKPVMWEIDVFGVHENDNREYLITIGANTDYILSVRNNIGKCFDNTSLVSLLKELAKVDEIEKFPGPMNQQIYDLIRQDESQE